MTVAWQQEQERGSRAGFRTMIWVAQRLGRPYARLLLYPICVYYLVSSGTARRAIGQFRERVFGRPSGWGELYRHFHTFGSTILDRVYFLRARFDLFDIRFYGLDILDRELAKGRGCLLLGAHLGSFEVVRSVGLSRRHLTIKVLMDEQNAPMMRKLIEELNPAVAQTVIQVGGVDTMLQVKECLDQGGMVGVMGDRIMPNDQRVQCSFLGAPAWFPTGAIRLARAVRAPVILFFGLYRGANRYDVHLEALDEEVVCTQELRADDLVLWVQRYADRIEQVCRRAPDNWFNFYDFWADFR